MSGWFITLSVHQSSVKPTNPSSAHCHTHTLLFPTQESYQEHDVVWCFGHKRASAENLQEPRAEGPAGGETEKKTAKRRHAVIYSITPEARLHSSLILLWHLTSKRNSGNLLTCTTGSQSNQLTLGSNLDEDVTHHFSTLLNLSKHYLG